MHIQITIQGVSPLLMNKFTEQQQNKGPVGDKGTPRQQAEKKAYADDKGNLYIPGPNVFAAIISAGRFHKAGKSKVTTNKSSLVPAGITLHEIVLPLNTKHFEVDSRSVVIPSTGGRLMAHRPRLDSWSLTFTVELDADMFSADFVRRLVDDAGKKVGLGDYRPERKGPFGRFVVTKWKVIPEAKAA